MTSLSAEFLVLMEPLPSLAALTNAPLEVRKAVELTAR